MKLANLPRWATELLERERVAHLAFLDEEDRPRVLPVTFALAEGGVWSAIDRKPKRTAEPARVRRLRRRPEASLCADVYDEDWQRLRWVQLTGRVVVLDPRAGAPGLAALAAKYVQYAGSPPPGPVLRLDVERAACWRGDEDGQARQRSPAANRSRPSQ